MNYERSYVTLRTTQGWRALALLALVSHLFVLIAASSCEVHHFFHPQSDPQHHICAATLLSLGQVDLAPAVVAIASPEVVCTCSPIPDIRVATVVHYRLLPARAPPSFASFLAVAG